MSTENKLVDERPATLAEHIQLIKDTTKQAAIVPHAWLDEWLKEAERQEQTIADLRARVEAQRGPGKVLTDEDLRAMVDKRLPPYVNGVLDTIQRGLERDAGYTMLVYARDNGYLAPAQPLSVDNIMEVYHEHEQWFNLHGGTPAKRSGNFKARLNKLIG